MKALASLVSAVVLVSMAATCDADAVSVKVIRAHREYIKIREKPCYFSLYRSMDGFDAWNVFVCIFEGFKKIRIC